MWTKFHKIRKRANASFLGRSYGAKALGHTLNLLPLLGGRRRCGQREEADAFLVVLEHRRAQLGLLATKLGLLHGGNGRFFLGQDVREGRRVDLLHDPLGRDVVVEVHIEIDLGHLHDGHAVASVGLDDDEIVLAEGLVEGLELVGFDGGAFLVDGADQANLIVDEEHDFRVVHDSLLEDEVEKAVGKACCNEAETSNRGGNEDMNDPSY